MSSEALDVLLVRQREVTQRASEAWNESNAVASDASQWPVHLVEELRCWADEMVTIISGVDGTLGDFRGERLGREEATAIYKSLVDLRDSFRSWVFDAHSMLARISPEHRQGASTEEARFWDSWDKIMEHVGPYGDYVNAHHDNLHLGSTDSEQVIKGYRMLRTESTTIRREYRSFAEATTKFLVHLRVLLRIFDLGT